MKLFTSSSSPSSSSTFSFDPTFCSSKTIAAGCFTTIFHRIREFHSKFTSEKVQKIKTNTISISNSTIISSSPSSSSSCIVARLMGLDSMAENKIETCSESTQSSKVHSVSQGFELLENENFLEFSFESGSESRKFKSKGRRKEKGCVDLKKRREERNEVKKNKREMVNDGEFQFEKSLFKEVGNGEKVKKRKKGKTCFVENKVESECGSEDSSPVSVFDFEYDVSGTDEDLCDVAMSWRRKLSPVLENDQLYIQHSDSNLMNEEMEVEEIESNMHEGSKKKERRNNECVDIWSKICRLVEDELVGTNGLQEVKRKQSDFESLSADLEMELLDDLLDELIDQFVTCL
ncbi:uncharacterized protein LOC131637246 [Vicia villosa]|uniref:uncharacterized protein LOC131637246 n=1 Tax=Vicia villosa TaxID=3911 RepID=UPI00273A779D|nr:uncharacterized protein LOC131637246 [Vicia villosa]